MCGNLGKLLPWKIINENFMSQTESFIRQNIFPVELDDKREGEIRLKKPIADQGPSLNYLNNALLNFSLNVKLMFTFIAAKEKNLNRCLKWSYNQLRYHQHY